MITKFIYIINKLLIHFIFNKKVDQGEHVTTTLLPENGEFLNINHLFISKLKLNIRLKVKH